MSAENEQSKVRSETLTREKAELLKEEEQRLAKKSRDDQDQRAQQDQIAQVRKIGGWYGFIYGLYGLITNFVSHFGHAIGVIGQVIPPVNVIIKGFGTILEMIEATFLSKETLNRRIVVAVNAFIQNTASIATLILGFNPATAPIGAAVALSAMTVSAAKDALFWYKASRDLRRAKDKLNAAEHNLREEQGKFLKENDDHKRYLQCVEKIKLLDPSLNPSQLAALMRERDNCIKKYNTALSDKFAKERQEIFGFKKEIRDLREQRNQRRSSFAYAAASIIGVTFLTIAAFAVAGAIVANPFTLGLVGLSILAATTAVMIKERFFSKKPHQIDKTTVIQPKEASVIEEGPDQQHDHQGDLFKINRELHIGEHPAPVVSRNAEPAVNPEKVEPPQAPVPTQAPEPIRVSSPSQSVEPSQAPTPTTDEPKHQTGPTHHH